MPRSQRNGLLASASSLGAAGLLAAVAMWGPAGILVWSLAMGVAGFLASTLSHRTERMYADRTREAGVPVFSALLNGSRGGDLIISGSGLTFERSKRRHMTIHQQWEDVRSVALKKKGPYGSAGILSVEPAYGPTFRFEISDINRLDNALRAVPAAASKLDDDG